MYSRVRTNFDWLQWRYNDVFLVRAKFSFSYCSALVAQSRVNILFSISPAEKIIAARIDVVLIAFYGIVARVSIGPKKK